MKRQTKLSSIILLILFTCTCIAFAGGQQEESTKETVEPKQELRIVIPTDIANFDPHSTKLVYWRKIGRLALYNTLAQYDENIKLQPQLAKSWEVSQDGKSYTFNLRNNVKFHNGKQFQAEDVKYTIEKVMNPDTGSPYKRELANVDYVELVDTYTVKVNLINSSFAFLDSLTRISIVPNDPSIDLKRNPVGTGPFKFEEYVPNDKIILVKNEDYWAPGEPKLDKLIITVITDSQVAVRNLEAGSVDYIVYLEPIHAEKVEASSDLRMEIIENTTDVLWFNFKLDEAPLSNPKIRQAMAHCFDYETFSKTTFQGLGTPTNSPISPLQFAHTDVGFYEYDLEKARQILREEGYPDGFDTVIWCLQGARFEDMSVIWKDGLDKVGINTTIEVREVQVWLEAYVNHNFKLCINESILTPDPFMYFNAPLGGDGYIEYFDNKDEIYSLVKKANNAALDEETRKAAYKDLQKWHFDELPIFQIYRAPILAGMSENVEGATFNATGFFEFSKAFIK